MTMSVKALRKSLLGHQLVRFVITGALNTGFGYVVYVTGLLADLSPATALAVATGVGACFNYWSTGRLVFHHTSFRTLPLFILAYGGIYMFNMLLLRLLISLGLGPALAQALLIPFVAAVSFIILKFLVFRQEGEN